MSWVQIVICAVVTAVPMYLWGYRHGYKKATLDSRTALMQSAVDRAMADNSGGGSL
jgi:hypothetical protein